MAAGRGSSSYDPTVLSQALTAAKRFGATPREVKALVEAGIVESGLQNLSGGDRDSVGFLQQRPSAGWKGLRNVPLATEEFLQHARALTKGGFSGSAGQLAQAVQRSAFPARYDQQAGQARQLLSGAGVSGSTTGPSVPTQGDSAGSQPQGTPQPTTGLTSVLSQLIGAQSTPPPASLPAPPKFTAGPTTPTGYQAPASSGGPTVKQSAADLLDQIQTPGGDIPAAQTQDTSAPQVGPSADGTVSAGAGAGGGYPLGRPGKVIGVPYQGTHTLGNWQSDNAVDIAVPVGTPMVADDSGVVVKVRHHPQDGGRFAGDQITIQGAHGNSYFYAHGVASVKPGQKIRAGQVIGRSGSANGVAHLHFGVEKGDPRKLLGSK